MNLLNLKFRINPMKNIPFYNLDHFKIFIGMI